MISRIAWIVVVIINVHVLTSAEVSSPLAVAGQQPKDDALDNYIRLVINNFFAALESGIPALGIPVMDPLWIGNLTIPTLTVKGGHIDAAISETAIHGISKFTVTSLHLDIQKLRMDLRAYLNYMKIDGGYSLEGIVLTIFPLYGDGPYKVEVFDIVMLGGGSLGLDETGTYLQLTSLVMDANFTTLSANFENLLGGGDLGDTLNDIISALGAAIFDVVKPIFIDQLTSGIMTVVNDALSRYPIGNLTKMMMSTGSGDDASEWEPAVRPLYS